MSEEEQDPSAAASARGKPSRRLPQGYRQGIITAITVLLGFSLTFLRFWSFEAPGAWAWYSIVSTGVVGVSVLLQLVALFRSLRPEDDEECVYRTTVKWFISAIALLVLGLFLVAVESSLT